MLRVDLIKYRVSRGNQYKIESEVNDYLGITKAHLINVLQTLSIKFGNTGLRSRRPLEKNEHKQTSL